MVSESLEHFFYSSDDLMCIIDDRRYFKKVNSTFVKTLGHTERELLSSPYVDFVHPEDLKKTQDEANQIQSGSASQVFENRYLKKDGSYCWLSWKSVKDGNLIYAVARDVTQAKLTEIGLRESEHKLKTVLENLPVTLSVFDAEGKILLVS